MKLLQKLIAVVGPTSSGKSTLAVELALRFHGEVVSADSRQIYRGLDIATGKITEAEMAGVPHHLLSIADPRYVFTAAEYQKEAGKTIENIFSRGKLPILCGGTGFYISAILDGVSYPEVPPDEALRNELEAKPAEEIFSILQKIDPNRAMEIDPKNRRRLIRAVEIAQKLGSVPPLQTQRDKQSFHALRIGLSLPMEELEARIAERVSFRLEHGMREEAEKLHRNGLSFDRMEEFGLEYRTLAEYLQGKITREEIAPKIARQNRQYAKRQMRWFLRDHNIRWFHPDDRSQIFAAVKDFLTS
ncbi:MAG TPA: tRNA (adenosine(37)-N6)-dimethylallyltransferase MiaA [Candidatus Paceibacterota bacterium]|nr:tRNA (adenosine(37)-N6)-dimethylallyltransferase MiaA [Candidatus Paceibacterota bacterium]